jgi:hypothetical protein
MWFREEILRYPTRCICYGMGCNITTEAPKLHMGNATVTSLYSNPIVHASLIINFSLELVLFCCNFAFDCHMTFRASVWICLVAMALYLGDSGNGNNLMRLELTLY